ncbi:LLM class flavin-dependent oxidoreductase [Streptomyces johnsoniae]|uniref:LLM class flavin-dependent oxidoreductase n=1 Tax=Streptomyces johnsoniae TaxID=3075532 RepID=A0ABU2S6S8_9ACTN|nr:LLM class flavin-dependent oxidoreductase [Streptomyces sp. DSM 41886]MDT0444513.1 LLM class flavin-dependent oxidoreductase [Streptomyces sp. DSM 41886]
MKLGLNFLPTVGPGEANAADYYRECLELCVLADRLGFSHVKAVEHYFCEWGGYSPDPCAFLSAVAIATHRVRLVTGAVIPAFTHPIRQAASLAVVDNLSGGRLDAGFARAFLPAEFEAFGVPLAESRARFEEGVRAVERLWREERFRWEGTFHRFGPLPPLLPRPAQRPCPPVFVAATVSPESFEWAGRHGYHLMIIPLVASHERLSALLDLYHRARADAGHPPTARMHVSYHLYVAEDPAEAMELAAAHYAAYQKKQIEAYSSWEGVQSDQYPGYEKMLDAVRATSFADLHAAGKVIAGDVDAVTDQLREVGRLYPGAEVSLHVRYGDTPHAEAVRSVTLLGERVLPRLSRAATAGGPA